MPHVIIDSQRLARLKLDSDDLQQVKHMLRLAQNGERQAIAEIDRLHGYYRNWTYGPSAAAIVLMLITFCGGAKAGGDVCRAKHAAICAGK